METPTHFHFSYRRMVEFADTDLAGIVHFANFFRYMECAEHAFFRSLGFHVHTTQGSAQHGWPRLDVTCKYLRPARFEQTLEIRLRIEEIRTSSLRYGFWIFGEGEKPHSPLAVGSCTIIYVELDTASHQIRKAPIRAELRAKIEEILASSPAIPSTPHAP